MRRLSIKPKSYRHNPDAIFIYNLKHIIIILFDVYCSNKTQREIIKEKYKSVCFVYQLCFSFKSSLRWDKWFNLGFFVTISQSPS